MIDGYIELLDSKNVSQDAFVGGLIGITDNGTILDNIHISNMKITTKVNSNNSDTFYIGGLVANGTETIIRNCSNFIKLIC